MKIRSLLVGVLCLGALIAALSLTANPGASEDASEDATEAPPVVGEASSETAVLGPDGEIVRSCDGRPVMRIVGGPPEVDLEQARSMSVEERADAGIVLEGDPIVGYSVWEAALTGRPTFLAEQLQGVDDCARGQIEEARQRAGAQG